jgi:hypothetical protein
MSLPTIEKTWKFNVNHSVGAGVSNKATNQQLLLDIKNMLIATGSLGTWTDATGAGVAAPAFWTVRYSSNSFNFGTPGDGIDRWQSITDVVPYNNPQENSPFAHSWIVLKSTALDPGTNFQLLIDYNSSESSAFGDASFIVSRTAGFTGGSLNARPTATDEVFCGSRGGTYVGTYDPIFGSINGIFGGIGYTLHALISTDGFSNRLIVSRGTAVSFILAIERSVTSPAGWTTPIYLIHASAAFGINGSNTVQNGTDAAISAGGLIIGGLPIAMGTALASGGGKYNLYMGQESFGGTFTDSGNFPNRVGAPFQFQFDINAFSNDYLISQIDLVSDSVGFMGRQGYISDMWSCSAPAGSTFPVGGGKTYAQFGKIMIPWNTTSPQT